MSADRGRPPAAILDTPPDKYPWTWNAKCYGCGAVLARIIHKEVSPGRGVYDRTMLLPDLVEQPGRDADTGWPRYAVRQRARLHGAPGTAGRGTLRQVKLSHPTWRELRVPIVVYCPNRPCGRRQTIDPEAESGPPPASGARIAEHAARLDHPAPDPARMAATPRENKPRPLVEKVRRDARARREAELAADPVKQALKEDRRRAWERERAALKAAEDASQRWKDDLARSKMVGASLGQPFTLWGELSTGSAVYQSIREQERDALKAEDASQRWKDAGGPKNDWKPPPLPGDRPDT